MAYEQKPNTFSLFKDSDDRIEERKKFYREKGWDEKAVPVYSGKLLLENGDELGIEARIVDGAKGKFFAGRVWKKKVDGYTGGSVGGNTGGSVRGSTANTQNHDDLDDDIPF